MKVKIIYEIRETKEKEIDMTPEEYCHCHAHGFGKYLPQEHVTGYEVELTEDAEVELDKFYLQAKAKKGNR